MNNTAERTDTRRTGEKNGWTVGWLGGFLWLLILSVVRLVQGRATEALIGLGLFALAVGVILFFAPWRHPRARYWKLTLPLYSMFFGSIAWAVRSSGGWAALGLGYRSFFWVLPCLIPLWTIGGRRWERPNE